MPTGQSKPTADFAIALAQSGERDHREHDDALRGPFALDAHRIIESTAFRRLEHKTQVFGPALHDHFRTRLTHTLEAAELAQCLADALGANAPLARAIILAHDLGHPPFGHAGEAALDAILADQGGFNHNLHSLRVVEYLEHPFPRFRGLNLTHETRAGLRSHHTRYDVPDGSPGQRTGASNRTADEPQQSTAGPPECVGADADVDAHRAKPLSPSAEAQIANLADRIAYNCHDLEDAIGAELADFSTLADLPLWGEALERAQREYGSSSHIFGVRRPVIDGIINALLKDAVAVSKRNLESMHSAKDVRMCPTAVVTLSAQLEMQLAGLERFLLDHVYRHASIADADARGQDVITALFDAYRKNPSELPPNFQARITDQGETRVIVDYIAGMTDRFCEAQHARL